MSELTDFRDRDSRWGFSYEAALVRLCRAKGWVLTYDKWVGWTAIDTLGAHPVFKIGVDPEYRGGSFRKFAERYTPHGVASLKEAKEATRRVQELAEGIEEAVEAYQCFYSINQDIEVTFGYLEHGTWVEMAHVAYLLERNAGMTREEAIEAALRVYHPVPVADSRYARVAHQEGWALLDDGESPRLVRLGDWGTGRYPVAVPLSGGPLTEGAPEKVRAVIDRCTADGWRVSSAKAEELRASLLRLAAAFEAVAAEAA